MDESEADVNVAVRGCEDLSLPEKLMLAERLNDEGRAVRKLLRQVHYCWAQIESAK